MKEVLDKFDFILNLPPQYFYMSNNLFTEIFSDLNSPFFFVFLLSNVQPLKISLYKKLLYL